MTNAATLAAVAASGFRRNRIQNGAMQIDQRTNFAGVTVTNGGLFADRWTAFKGAGGSIGASVSPINPPAPLQFGLVWNVTAGAAPAAGEYVGFAQSIEGSDMADLQWGYVTAKPATLSFAVLSPLVGVYGFRIRNHSGSRNYVGTYTVNAANTWETKQITIPGDTTGAWGVTPADKWQVFFDMGSGTSLNTTTPGVWTATGAARTAACVIFSSAVRVFVITAIQLEAGSVATPFEWLPIRQQLADCQRWFQKGSFYNGGAVPGVVTIGHSWPLPVVLRTTPSVALLNQSLINVNGLSSTFTTNVGRIQAVGVASGGYLVTCDYTLDCEGT